MAADPMRELEDGVAFWKKQPKWHPDFHNEFYRDQAAITDGTFSPEWWVQTRRKLYDWRATRGTAHAVLNARFQERHADLVRIWQTVIEPRLADDITTVDWEDVKALPELAASIKPTKTCSGVFPSKFSHFIAPSLFPVLDRTALPGGGQSYGAYFDLVKRTWEETSAADRRALVARLSTSIRKAGGGSMVNGYPIVNKVVELRLIGRRHPATGWL